MSSGNTETRILQMQLENKDFEDGVRQTIKSLESLEEKLNLKNAGDGFQRVSAAANSVQMSHLESGIDAVTNKFTLMGQVGLQVLERVSSKIVDTSEKILRAATIQPMIDGWGEFEMKTGSIQTILGGIRKDFDDQPTAIHAISDALDELNEYADKTIYNFAQMTENVGKFTNQGLDLKTSTNAIKGIANWAAAVGADPAQMSRAMYNISQSLGAGSMQLIDWRSIRFANMATPEVKKLFAEVAKKVNPGAFDKDGKVRVSKKQTVDVLKDFETSLKAGWLTNDVMAEAFGIYAKAFSKEDLIAKYGEELGKQFYEMGEYAEEAATKVRTVTQLIGVLKEGLGSGWAQSFDILLGGFEKQTEFLTAIKDSIEEITNFQTKERNDWLTAFSNIGGIDAFQQSILNTLTVLKDFYWVLNDVISLVVNPFGWTSFNMTDGIFGPKQVGYTEMKSTWYGVKQIFDDINRTMENFRKWMYKPNDKTGRSPIHNLANALSGVAGAAGIAWQVLTGFGKFVFRIFKRFEPLVSAVLDLVGQIGGAIYNVFFNLTGQQTVEKIFDRIEGAIGPVVDIVVGLATAVVDLIHSFLGIDKAADDWTVLGDRMKAFWKIFEYNKDLGFADNLKNSVKQALISIFGKDTADDLIKAWDDNIAPVLEQISNFFTDVFDGFNRVIEGLKKAAGADYSKEDSATGKAGIFLNSFLSGYNADDQQAATEAYTNILSIYQEIEQYYNDNVKPHVDSLVRIFTEDLPAVNDKIAEFLFGPKSVVADYNGQHLTSHYGNRSGGLFGSIADAFKPENLDSIIKEVEDAWEKFNTVLFGPKSVVANYNGQHLTSHYERNGGIFGSITEFFNSETWAKDWALIEDAFNSVSNWITTKGQQAWQIIMDFLFGPEVVVADRNGQNLTSHYERQGGAYEAAISFLTPVWDWLESTGKKLYEYITTHDFQQMWDGLNRLLFGYDEIVADRNGPNLTSKMVHQGGVLTPVVEMLKPIAEVFEQIKGWALEKIGGIDFGKIWESIGKFFGGYDEVVTNVGKGPHLTSSIVHHDGVFERITNFFDRIIAWYDEHKETFDKIFGWIGGLGETIWGALDDLFSGKGFGGFGAVWEYLKGGATSLFNKIFNKIFPEGFDLGGLLVGNGEGGSLLDMLIPGFSNGGQDAEKTVEQVQNAGDGLDFFSQILKPLTDLLSGADAAEAEVAEAADTFAVNTDQAKKDSEKAADKGTGAMDGLLGIVSKLLPYFGGAAAIGLVGKVGDMITGITGNRKPTIIEQISALLASLAEPLKGLALAIAAAGAVEKFSPGTLDKIFRHITDLLSYVFRWFAGGGLIGSIVSFFGNKWLGKALGPKNGSNFANVTDTIEGIGTGMQGVFEGLQALFTLAWEVAGTDLLMGKDKVTGEYNFDKKIDRVLGFITKVLGALLENDFLTKLTDMNALTTIISGITSKISGVETPAQAISSVLTGVGTFIHLVLDGVSGIMTASIVPGFMNVDIEKISGLITAVLNTLNWFVGMSEGTSVLSKLVTAINPKAGIIATLEKLVDKGIFLAFFYLLGKIGQDLVKGYMEVVTEGLPSLSASAYSFFSNIMSIISGIADLAGEGDNNAIAKASEVMQTDIPKLLEYATSDDIHYDKGKLDERGEAIQLFGNRVKNGILSLAAAKETFDKYNTGGEDSFPLAFFEAMTEGLRYFESEGISELYDEFHRAIFPSESEIADKQKGVEGLTSFFGTMNTLGYVVRQPDGWYEIESTEKYLSAFVTNFQGLQTAFSSLVDDMGKSGFTAEKVELLKGVLQKLVDVGIAFADTFVNERVMNGLIYKAHDSYSPISQLGSWLQTTGQGIRDFNTALQNSSGEYDIDYTKLDSAIESLQKFAEIEHILYGYSRAMLGGDKTVTTTSSKGAVAGWLLGGYNTEITEAEYQTQVWNANMKHWVDDLFSGNDNMSKIGEGLHKLSEQIKPEDLASLEIASNTMNSLAELFSNFKYTATREITTVDVEGYASAFTQLKQSLLINDEEGGRTLADLITKTMTAANGNTVQVRIAPVIDDSNLGANLPTGLDLQNTYSRMINMQLNMKDVQNVHVDAAQIQAIVASNNEIRTGISDLSAAIRQIKIQVNAPSPAYGPSRGTTLVYPLMPNYQAVP